MKNIICKFDIITLRKTVEEDLGFVINAEREQDNAQYVGQWTREQHLNVLENEDILHLIVENSNTAVSVCSYGRTQKY